MFDVCEDTGQTSPNTSLACSLDYTLSLPCLACRLTSISAGAWVEGMVEEDGQDAGVLEEGEDISKNSAFGPASPSTPSTPMAISQSHKKS